MIKAVIFDKDGVLMLTEIIYHRAFQDILKQYGSDREYTWENHQKLSGKPTTEVILALKELFGLKFSVDEFIAEYRNRYKTIFKEDGLKVPQGVKELLDSLKKERMSVAVATGASRESTELTLEKTGLRSYFDVICTSSDVAKGKPDPEVFLLAAKRLGVNPHECLVIGDSVNDTLGAKAAGMKMIAITDESYSRDPELALPDIEVKEFKAITLEMIQSL